MEIIEAYRVRIRQATSTDEKQAIAAELHQLADTFDEPTKAAYRLAMKKLRDDIADRLEAVGPRAEQATEIISRLQSQVSQS